MDGHERSDVVKYRQEVFLPAILEFEACMAKFEGKDLQEVPPDLQEGARHLILLFHDECCFHA